MAKLTTRQALQRLLFDEDYLLLWVRSGYSKPYRSQCRHRFKRGKLSLGVQQQLLSRCGFLLVVEPRWETPGWSAMR